MPRCFLRLCSRSVEPLCGKPWLDGSGCSLLLIGVVEPSSWDFRLVQFPEVQKQLKNLVPCHFCPTEANFYHGMVWALVQKNGQKHASGFRRKPANTNGSRALIWRTSTRSYLTCLFLCAGTFGTKFFLFVLHFAFGVGAFNTTTYCSVSRMSWTCTYRGSVWGKHIHTHTNDVSCGDYMVAYEDFAHVGVACLIFSCGTIVHWFRVLPRTPKAGCVFAHELSRLVWENVLWILGAVLPFVFVDHKFNVCWCFKGQDLMGVGALWHDISQSPCYTVAIVPQSNQQPLHHQHLFILVSVFCWSHPNRATGTFIVH